ncbi:MAG: tetratricopeptide repeat protein [Betaproteobacteria bacterium]
MREHLAAGDRENSLRHPREALVHYELALQTDPRNYAGLWKASGDAIDLGEAETDAPKREALYAKAMDYARRAVAITPDGAEGHFNLARALGRMALSLGPRDRVKYGTEVRAEALRTLELDPRHPGAMHVMGVWNAEVMRLNGITRLFAKTLLGGQILGKASWAEAAQYMEQSVTIDPDRAVHRLDLARVYRDTGRRSEARAAYEAAAKAPFVDANDEMYKRAAADELRALK